MVDGTRDLFDNSMPQLQPCRTSVLVVGCGNLTKCIKDTYAKY